MGLWLSTLVLLAGISGEALPGVVVLSADEASRTSGFIDNLQIQLTGLASVTLGPPPATESTAERAERARLYLSATGASIAVWKEQRAVPGSGRRQVVVLAVTRYAAQQPIEVARIDAAPADDVDRILALKVGELLHQVLATATSEQELAEALARGQRPDAEPAPAPPPAAPPPAAPTPAAAPPLRVLLEAGLGLRVDSSFATPQVMAHGALGGSLHHQGFRLELALHARWLNEVERLAPSGRLVVAEAGAGIELRALKLLPPFAVGAHAGIAADFLGASATSLDGRRGGADKIGSSWSAGPEVRLELLPALEMRSQVAGGTTLYDQRFAITGQTVEDGSNTRFSGELSLIYWIP